MNATTSDADATGYEDGDRLPWLESAEEEYREGPSAARVIGLILLGLAVLAAGILGYNWYRNRTLVGGGTGEMINAQDGDYKVKPDEPGGMKVEGEGDTVFATSEGGPANKGSIDTKAVPETPVKGKTAAAPGAGGPGTSKVVTEVPARGGALAPRTPAAGALPAASGGGGSVIQLGSFPNEAAANTAWAQISKRLTYLAPLGKSVERAEVAGRTVYRLRVNAGSAGAAASLCGRVKVAGEACYVP